MLKKLFSVFIILFFVASITPVLAKTTNVWKSTSIQEIPRGKWTTLKFGKKSAMEPFGTRSLYCSQVHLTFGKSKPKWVKIRIARVLPSGKLDTTGTNTWVLGKNSPRKWQGATCWAINPNYPVVAQVKYGGGPKTVKSPLRQFKSWNPNATLEDSVLIFSD